MSFTYKLSILVEWLPILINQIKDDLKQWLQKNKPVYMLYFTNEFNKYKTKEGKVDTSPLNLHELLTGFKQGRKSIA